MICGTTKSGFDFKIPKTNMNNMELLDIFVEIDDGKVELFTKAAELLLGKQQKKALYDHLRTEKGNVPVEIFISEIKEIMNNSGETGKNS